MSHFSKQLLGEWPVYPGHPLTIATVIMHCYETLDAAAANTEHNWPAALGNGDVPGAGGEVYVGLDLLLNIRAGKVSIEEAPAEAQARWLRNGAGGHTDRIAPGQEQADRFQELFLSKASEWFKAVPQSAESLVVA